MIESPMPASLFALLAISIAARAQEPAAGAPASEAQPNVPAAGHSLHGETFDEGPRQRAALLEGMGAVSFPVTAANTEAQAFVAQGVAQLHTFYYLEAERSFRQAAALDPHCAMAYWGMAMANVNNEKRAKGFLKELETTPLDGLSRRERLYVDALNALYAEGGDEKGRRLNYTQGLETIVQEFPDDLEARAFLALAAWQNGQKDGFNSRQAIEEMLRSIERAAPMHPGVHHYRIHLWDGVKPAMAEGSAGLYAKAAPGIAHAWHMPGHTYDGLKRYADAARQQEGSARVDHAAMARDRVLPFEIHNYAHNNQWLATSLGRIGRAREAIAVARNLVEQPRDPQKNEPNDGGSCQRSGRARWAETLTKFELWDELIDAAASGALDWSDLPIERKDRALALGLAYAHLGRVEELKAQIDALRGLEPEEKDDGEKKDGKRDRKVPGLDAAIAELEAHLAAIDGRDEDALARLETARPRAEERARLLLRLGRNQKAEGAARDAVRDQENQYAPLATLVEVLAAIGKEEEARAELTKLRAAFADADRDLPVARRLEELASRWGLADAATSEPARADGVLEGLGPLLWSPFAAEALRLEDTEGRAWDLREHRGRNVVALFFLGGKCAHCLQQLKLFGEQMAELEKLDADLVAVSTDDAETTRLLKTNSEGIAFPMPMLADPKLEVFQRFRCHDDFEGAPLHGIFLIDRDGMVRYRRISSDPFLDIEFVKRELSRMNRLCPPRTSP
jgi:peroxiredoxin